MQPPEEEIDEQLNLASHSVEQGGSRWTGMTYEQGVQAALLWVTGRSDEPPMED